ncbi:hypothetical protein B0A49_07519 [Cryomyces minteri]|uniref:Casein kinase II beta 2 subunit n=1 Tax=Cryomyces minteri TaxID=331657 RepID=A0A4U0WWN2_9PEZI|nr:hypothetical protein B0A49_07519 [Cryomyces minteri]
MVSSLGHLHRLVAKNAKLFRLAWKKTSKLIQAQLPAETQFQPVLVRNTPRHPIHPAAYLKQSRGRWYTTHSTINATVRRFTSSAQHSAPSGVKYDRASFPKSRIGSIVNSQAGRAPFASTLRPNLTGGTLGRTAGGYTLGSGRIGGVRHFSHSPTAQAHVVQNVSQAIRAFAVSGQKAQFDGMHPRTGEKRYKAVSALQEETGRKMRSLPKATPGSYIDFNVNPTITALTPMNAVASIVGYEQAICEKETLNTSGLLDVLSVDFSRALKELAAVLNDLKRLSSLGDLPITYRTSSLRVHFPGCDAESVERLCEELNVSRGVVCQDKDFDAFNGTEIALLFPFAPSATSSEASFYEKPAPEYDEDQGCIDWRNMLSPEDAALPTPAYSTQSESGFEELDAAVEDNPWICSPSGYDSLPYSSEGSVARYERTEQHSPLEYQGFEGIYRFIEQCDAAKR